MGMTTNEAIEILIAVAVCESPILSCESCARCLGIGTDCTHPTDHEIEEAVLLLKGASKDMAISALRQQERLGETNKSLTMDELRQMDGEPVWVVYDEDAGMWALVEVLEESIFLTNNLGGRSEYATDVELEDDGITVYRRKLEEGTI